MYTEEFQRWLNINKYFTAPFQLWNNTLTNLYERGTEHQIQLLGENFSRLSDQLKRFSNIKNPEDYLHFQQQVITEDAHAVVHNLNIILRESMRQLEELIKLLATFNDQSNNIVNNEAKKTRKENKN